MRCKKHLSDLSSSVGVCASCLRERLFAVMAAQAQAQAQARVQVQQQLFQEDHRKSDGNPPPLMFPRSVSPYISRRKSDTTPWQFQHNSLPSIRDQRFYSTPQVGPNGFRIRLMLARPRFLHRRGSPRFSLVAGKSSHERFL
uniref:Uncharacterized protein n=1 Tax=Solanum tuberosum TaxID=4113 RepID=M0ZN37_SOLTU